MKRFFAVLSSLLVLPAFAEVAPVYYDEIVEYTDEMIDAIDDAAETQDVVQPETHVASRPTTTSRSGVTRTAADTRKTTNRATVSRTAVTPTRQTAQRSTVSRSGVTTRSRQTAQQTSPAVRARTSVGKNGAVAYTNKANTVGYVTRLNDSGNSLYNPTSTTTGTNSSSRVGVTSQRRASAVRISTATTPVITEQDIETTTSNLDAIAELTDYCKAQYAACMDNYCNVLDDNQGRCSCSKNLKNYQKVEEALAAASSDFQDTVQKIKYIGLTADQVTSLFAETEAELALSSNKDQSKLNSSLDAIKRKIIDATSPTSSSSYVSGTGVSMDLSGLLDFDLSSAFDLSSFLNTGTKSSTTSVTNQRGEQLYKTAAARCKSTILDSCTAQGIEANIITNSYDLEIDKQCMAYERNLNDANAEMKENVRNAAIILQQARLMLAQNKNSYDFRGCVAAIDACMQDEYVCGTDYELCLDPTGKYISGGEIVKGGTPGMPGGTVVNTELITQNNMDTWTSKGMYDLYATWNCGPSDSTENAWGGGKDENLNQYIDYQLGQWKSNYNRPASQNGSDIATFLLQKVGYVDSNDKVQGMCASAMKQCQEYTFDTSNSKKVYKPNFELTKYGMLVCSCNNAAVENISLELPEYDELNKNLYNDNDIKSFYSKEDIYFTESATKLLHKKE